MSVNIDDYRCKLINKIINAGSRDEVQSFIYTAVKELKEHEVHNYIIRRFIDKRVYRTVNRVTLTLNNILILG